MRRIILLPVLLTLVAAGVPTAPAMILYETEFEEFPAGPDQWAGNHGWAATSTGLGVHGIDQDILPGLGKTAFLGYARPDATFVTVFRPLDYDPLAQATPIVELEALVGIEDSTNGFRDSFFLTLYNSAGNLLASVRFDNSEVGYGIWRLDGLDQVVTGVGFVRSELHLFFASIDVEANTWSADLDGIPLFDDAPFNASGQTLDLGFFAVEWQLDAEIPAEHGNNWMLVSDLAIRALPAAADPAAIEHIGADTAGRPVVRWTGAPGFDDRVEYSDGLVSWSPDLAGSLFTNVTTEAPLTFTDESGPAGRSYRIRRTPAP